MIPKDEDMQTFLLFLIYSLQTIDGTKGTATPLISALNKQSVHEYKRKTSRTSVSKGKEHQIMSSNEHSVYRKVLLKYKIMRIRAKISFSALYKR